jgi:hypothetical protein
VRHPLLALAIATALTTSGGVAFAQSTFDSPVAKRPPPNVMLLLGADRTMGIEATCSNGCHRGGAANWNGPGAYLGDPWNQGITRIQIVRRALTGGWGLNTTVVDPTNGPADAMLRTDGIMDAYKVRWGVAWYDGIGLPRLAVNPTTDNDLAQRAVINFGQTANDWYNYANSPPPSTGVDPGLNSWETFPFTAWHGCSYAPPPYDPWATFTSSGAVNHIPWESDRASQSPVRIARSLYWVRDYWDPNINAPAYAPTSNQLNGGAGPIPAYPANLWFSPPNLNCAMPATDNSGTPQGCDVHDVEVINNDIANVLNHGCGDSSGCRRNFTILISDGDGQGCGNGLGNGSGHGSAGNCDWGNQVDPPYDTTACVQGNGINGPGDAASEIYNLNGCGCGSGSGSGVCDQDHTNQVFSIHVGDPGAWNGGTAWVPADSVADCGWDGANGGPPGTTTAFQAAPGGVLSLPPIIAAFGAIFSLVLAGSYTGAAPTITRAGTQYCDSASSTICDRMVIADFSIENCAGVSPIRCNIGRPAQLKWVGLDPTTGAFLGGYPASCTYPGCFDMGSILRSRDYSDRQAFTTWWGSGTSQWGSWTSSGNQPTETNCTPYASCATQVAMVLQMDPISFPAPLATNMPFILGKPDEMFVPSIPGSTWRGDTDTDMIDDTGDPYKLSDIENSRAVVVGAPPGLGEDLLRWNAFKSILLNRNTPDSTGRQAIGGPASTFGVQNTSGITVGTRDQVLYVGANDGFLHAFLVGVPSPSSKTLPGSEISYQPVGNQAPDGAPPIGFQAVYGFGATMYDGQEIWAYSPGLVQQSWDNLRGGRAYTVDGTPVIEDVLFTKNTSAPPHPQCGTPSTIAGQNACAAADWEYRTVLVQCLGAGGPGCFAMDVTNPWDPHLLWERNFTIVNGKGTSTSQPQIVKLKRTVAGKPIPYYAAVMGGGHNESGGTGKKGTFIAVGIEDGMVFTGPSCTPGVDPGCADFSGAPSCIDADTDGYVDTCYIVTTAAAIYKVRFGDTSNLSSGNPDSGTGGSITMAPFFVGQDSTAANDTTIRAFTKVIATSDINNHLNLFFATGNLDSPSTAGETNYVFKLYDLSPRQQPLSAPWTPALNTSRQANACSASPPFSGSLTQVNGGSFALPAGEKVLFDPAIVGGSVLFTTYAPDPNPCILGQGFLYGFKYDTCGSGLTPAGQSGAPSESKQNLGQSLPGQVAVNYGNGNIYVADTSKGDTVNANPAKPPSPNQFRVQKLNWRRM